MIKPVFMQAQIINTTEFYSREDLFPEEFIDRKLLLKSSESIIGTKKVS